MTDLNARTIWSRGLTVSDRGKNIGVGGHTFLLRNVEHVGDRTYLDVVTRIEISGRDSVVVYDG